MIFQVMCTRWRVIAVWLCTALILAAISFHFFVTVTYPVYDPFEPSDPTSPDTNTTATVEPSPYCYVQPAYRWFFTTVWYWIDFTLLAFVPFVVVLTGNCVMVTCIVRAVRFRHRQDPHLVASAGRRLSGVGGAVPGDKGKVVTSSTLMLMTVSVVFFLTTSPNVVFFVKLDDWLAEADDEHTQARLHLAFTATNLLYYTNNASNFFLYCLSGSRFRRAMFQMFRCSPSQETRSVGGSERQPAKRNGMEMDDRQRRMTQPPPAGVKSTASAAEPDRVTLSTNATMRTSLF